MRATAIEATGGYREDVVAAEEDELSIRLRAAGWRIWRLDREMASHDAGMTRFGQWWRRASRCGYAFAQGAQLHGAHPERHFVWETGRAWLWGACLPLTFLTGSLLFGRWAWAAFLIYPLQIFRQAIRNRGSLHERTLLALFQMLARFPEVLGQLKFLRDRMLMRQAHIIEYK
jgi:cellulose synthase/poly-beta-1,6-N-acetylglucosamine synthase-like glycosyltransferase